MKIVSYNSRILNPQEQKRSTLYRELRGIVHALQIDEFIMFGSPHLKQVFTDHKPLFNVLQKREILAHAFTELNCN